MFDYRDIYLLQLQSHINPLSTNSHIAHTHNTGLEAWSHDTNVATETHRVDSIERNSRIANKKVKSPLIGFHYM